MFDIVIESLRYKNICSVGSEFIEVELNKHNKTLVTGKNGAGKSTMIEALCFLLYGKAFRNITKDGLINSYNKKQLVVEGKIRIKGHDYFIQRGIKPNMFKIHKDGELIPECASVLEYQKLFENEILGLSINAFKQIIVLGKAGFVPFMELSTAKRRELVEELLDIAVIGDMNKLNKQQTSELKTKKEQIERDIDSTCLLLDSKRTQLEQQKHDNNQRIEQVSSTCKGFVVKVKDLKSKLEQLDKESESLKIDKEKLSNGYFEHKKKEITDTVEETRKSLEMLVNEYKTQIPSNSELTFLLNELLSKRDQVLLSVNSKPKPELIPEIDAEHIEQQLFDVETSIKDMELNKVPVFDFDVKEHHDSLNDIQTKQNEITNTLVKLKMQRESIQKKIEMFSSGDICPCCERPLTDEHIDGGIDALKTEIDVIEKEERALKAKYDDFSESMKEKNHIYSTKLDEYEQEKSKYDSALSQMKEQHKTLTNELYDIRLKISTAKNELDRFVSWVESESYRINSEYEKNVTKCENEHTDKVNQLNVKIADAESKLANIGQTLELKLIQLDNERMKIESDIESRIEFNKQNLLTTRDEIAYNSDKAREHKLIVDELKAKVFDSAEIDELIERIRVLKTNVWMVNDELNCCVVTSELLKDTGVKSYIIKQYLPVFNNTINTYLNSMGADYALVLNEQFEESILTKGRETQKYENFSQGEASRINFALLMTWRDVASIISGTRINLLVLDEIFDGATDVDGVHAINKALSDMNANVVVMSHRAENTNETFDRHLQFEKKGRFTRLVV